MPTTPPGYNPAISFPSPITVENPGTAGTDHAYLEVKVAATTSGDPHVRFTIPGGTSWYAGPDNSASDTLILGTGTAVGTNGLVFVDTSGNVGIGIAPTAGKLHVEDGAASTRIHIRNSLASGFGMFEAQNSNGNAVAGVRAYGSGGSGTFFGVTVAGAAVFLGQPSANGTLIGSFTNFPVVMGVNDVEMFRLTTDSRVRAPSAPTGVGEGRYIRRAHVQTTNATVTTIATVAIGTSKIHALRVSLTALRSTSAEGAYYERLAAYKNNAGTVTLIGAAASPITAEDAAAWDITLTISTTNVLVQVTGAVGSTIEWECVVEEVVTAAA